MSKITQYSRISHHTITGSMSATFSVPLSEDFTDGTWNSRDLSLSEIGVNEDSKKAYIRINDEVKEIQFAGGTPSGGEDLAATLAIGNTTGANWIEVESGYGLSSSIGNITDLISVDPDQINNGTGIFSTNTGTGYYSNITATPTRIYLYSEEVATGNYSQLYNTAGQMSLNATYNYFSALGVITSIADLILVDPQGVGNGTGIKSENTTTGNISSSTYTPDTIISLSTDIASTTTDTITLDPQGLGNGTGIKSENTTSNNYGKVELNPVSVKTEVKNASTLQQTSIISTQTSITSNVYNTTEQSDLIQTPNHIQLQAYGTTTSYIQVNKKVIQSYDYQTSNNTITTMFSIPSISNSGFTIKASILGVKSDYTKVYGSEMFAVFRNVGGTITQISTTDATTKTDFSTAVATIDASGSNYRVRITGEAATTINWSLQVEYITGY
jgi:hypothetical protein